MCLGRCCFGDDWLGRREPFPPCRHLCGGSLERVGGESARERMEEGGGGEAGL